MNAIIYQKDTGKKVLCSREVERYTDVDYAGLVVGKRSTSGYCILHSGNLMMLRSKKQNVVVCSNAEVECQVMTQALSELLWLKIILEDFKIQGNGLISLL